MNKKISIIGGGLAGSEAAYTIAKVGYKVDLYEMKPVKFSLAHSNENLAEIVCSNSFKFINKCLWFIKRRTKTIEFFIDKSC